MRKNKITVNLSDLELSLLEELGGAYSVILHALKTHCSQSRFDNPKYKELNDQLWNEQDSSELEKAYFLSKLKKGEV